MYLLLQSRHSSAHVNIALALKLLQPLWNLLLKSSEQSKPMWLISKQGKVLEILFHKLRIIIKCRRLLSFLESLANIFCN